MPGVTDQLGEQQALLRTLLESLERLVPRGEALRLDESEQDAFFVRRMPARELLRNADAVMSLRKQGATVLVSVDNETLDMDGSRIHALAERGPDIECSVEVRVTKATFAPGATVFFSEGAFVRAIPYMDFSAQVGLDGAVASSTILIGQWAGRITTRAMEVIGASQSKVAAESNAAIQRPLGETVIRLMDHLRVDHSPRLLPPSLLLPTMPRFDSSALETALFSAAVRSLAVMVSDAAARSDGLRLTFNSEHPIRELSLPIEELGDTPPAKLRAVWDIGFWLEGPHAADRVLCLKRAFRRLLDRDPSTGDRVSPSAVIDLFVSAEPEAKRLFELLMSERLTEKEGLLQSLFQQVEERKSAMQDRLDQAVRSLLDGALVSITGVGVALLSLVLNQRFAHTTTAYVIWILAGYIVVAHLFVRFTLSDVVTSLERSEVSTLRQRVRRDYGDQAAAEVAGPLERRSTLASAVNLLLFALHATIAAALVWLGALVFFDLFLR